jgi:hypothetical protein
LFAVPESPNFLCISLKDVGPVLLTLLEEKDGKEVEVGGGGGGGGGGGAVSVLSLPPF